MASEVFLQTNVTVVTHEEPDEADHGACPRSCLLALRCSPFLFAKHLFGGAERNWQGSSRSEAIFSVFEKRS